MKTTVSLKTVREIMAKPPETVTPDLTVGALLKLFNRHLADAFPVVNEDGVLLGLVSRLDVLRLLRPDPDLRMPDRNTVARQRVERIMRHASRGASSRCESSVSVHRQPRGPMPGF